MRIVNQLVISMGAANRPALQPEHLRQDGPKDFFVIWLDARTP